MSDKNNDKRENPNIGKNTRWDTPKVKPTAGSTIPKPSKSLTPRVKPKNK